MKIEKVYKQPEPVPVEKVVVEFTPGEWDAVRFIANVAKPHIVLNYNNARELADRIGNAS